MAKGYQIGVGVDTKAAKQSIDAGLVDPLEDAQKELLDLGRSKGPEQLERSLKDAQDESERLKKETEETADAIDREYRRAYREAKESSEDFTRSSSENVQGFKDEAIQNFSEVASSFDGDMRSMADGVQGLTGGLASSLTPGVGIPIAIIGAAAGAFLASWAESTEEAKERVSDMYQDMIESGQAFLSEDFISKALADIIGDDAKRQKAIDDAKRLGVETSTALRAQAGDQAAINELVAKAAELKQAEVDAVKANGEPLEQQAIKLDAINTRYGEILDTYTGITSETQKAIEQVNLYRDATGKAASADQQRYEALGRALAGVPDQKVVKVDIDTSAAERKINELVQKDRTIRVSIDGKSYGRY